MLTLKQAWQAIVNGKISAQNGGVAIDTSNVQEENPTQANSAEAQQPTEKIRFTASSLGVSHQNPQPDILPDENSITDDERIFSALSYFPFISFFIIATRKDSLFIVFHAWQGFVFFALFVVSLPIYWLFGIIPGMGIVFWFFYLFLFIAGFYGSFAAWSGRYVTFPFISAFAQKLSGTKTIHS